MLKVGDIVRYTEKFSTPKEREFRHEILEITLNPITMEMTRYKIINLDVTYLNGIHPTEIVESEMIELI